MHIGAAHHALVLIMTAETVSAMSACTHQPGCSCAGSQNQPRYFYLVFLDFSAGTPYIMVSQNVMCVTRARVGFFLSTRSCYSFDPPMHNNFNFNMEKYNAIKGVIPLSHVNVQVRVLSM